MMSRNKFFQAPVLCPTHNREVELYCPEKDSTICLMCVATTHHGFKCQSLNEAYQEKKQIILERNEKLRKIIKDLTKASEEVEKTEKDIDKQEGQVKKEIGDFFEQLQKELNLRQQTLLSEVSTLIKQKKNILQQQNSNLKSIESGFLSGLDQLDQFLQHQTLVPARILLLNQQLNQLYENYEKPHLFLFGQ